MIIQRRIELVTKLLPLLNKPLIVAEIGVAEGNFSRDILAQGAELVYMVDNWGEIKGQRGDGGFANYWHKANLRMALKNTQPWRKNRKILKGMSVDMAKLVPDESLSLVYLDADHSFDGVCLDIRTWLPKVVKGGVMAGHDYLNPDYGVYDAVHLLCNDALTIPENNPEDASFYFIK